MSEREQERMLQEIPLPEQKECKKAAERAMKLLLQQDRTRKELQDRLYRAGFSERAAEYALAYVSRYGYIDDFRYASRYISFQKDKRSRKELRYKLLDKGVDSEVIAAAFEQYGPEDEYGAIRRLLQKRLKGAKLIETDMETKNKIIAFFARKGYALSSVKRVMKEWGETESNGSL